MAKFMDVHSGFFGVTADQLNEVRNLVDMSAVRGLPVTPLLAVDRPKVAFVIGPFIPDADLPILEPADVRVAAQEPQEFDDDRAQVQLLRRQQGEAVTEIEAHLRTEIGKRAGAGAVLLLNALVEDPLHEVEVLAHVAAKTNRLLRPHKPRSRIRCG